MSIAALIMVTNLCVYGQAWRTKGFAGFLWLSGVKPIDLQ